MTRMQSLIAAVDVLVYESAWWNSVEVELVLSSAAVHLWFEQQISAAESKGPRPKPRLYTMP